jgi:hypothetical protein
MDSKQDTKRWFSTGFMAKGAGKVLFETHTLEGASVIQCGEAKGHGIWIDNEFCNQVVVHSTLLAEKGLKARFGHPDMCSDALGTFLGKWKQLAIADDGIVKGNLYLSSTASDSPKGDLRKYVEEMADKEPDHFGCSIVFSRDQEKEIDFACEHGAVIEFGKGDWEFVKTGECKKFSDIPEDHAFRVSFENWKSPDVLNVKNLPHARCAKLHAADLVDDPAATDSMFSGIGGTQLASKVSEYLDTHPEVLKSLSENKEIVEILSKYPDQIKPFIDRFTANRKENKNMSTEATPVAESTPVATPEKEVDQPKSDEGTTAETVKPEEATPPPVGDTEKPKAELSRGEFTRIADRFGNDIAVRCMREGANFETALSWHVEAIEKENSLLKSQISEFTGTKTTGKAVAMTATAKPKAKLFNTGK